MFFFGFNNVFGAKPEISTTKSGKSIVFGSIGKSLLIDECIKNAGIDVSAIKDKYELYHDVFHLYISHIFILF